MTDRIKTKKPLIITLAVIVLIVGFSVLTYGINVQRINNGRQPLFVFHANSVNDGGTKIYYGLGYHIVEWNSMFQNTPPEKSDFAELTDIDMNINIIYVRGTDIGFGFNDWNTVKNGPSPEHTIGFRFE